MIIDAFPYAGEEILKIRLHELSPVVTKFLIIESNRTQSGREKPYHFEQQSEKYNDFLSQIIYVKLDDSKIDSNGIGETDWSQEHRVRQAISNEGFQKLEENGLFLMANDTLLISDADEIPRKECVEDFDKSNQNVLCLNHYFNSYYLNLYSNYRTWGWYGTICIRAGNISNNIQYLRNVKDRLPHSGKSGEGWHFSNILSNGFRSLYSKLINNIEPHSKDHLYGYKNIRAIKKAFDKCLYEDLCFFFSDNWNNRAIPLEILENEFLPKYVQENLDKFKYILYSEPEYRSGQVKNL